MLAYNILAQCTGLSQDTYRTRTCNVTNEYGALKRPVMTEFEGGWLSLVNRRLRDGASYPLFRSFAIFFHYGIRSARWPQPLTNGTNGRVNRHEGSRLAAAAFLY